MYGLRFVALFSMFTLLYAQDRRREERALTTLEGFDVHEEQGGPRGTAGLIASAVAVLAPTSCAVSSGSSYSLLAAAADLQRPAEPAAV